MLIDCPDLEKYTLTKITITFPNLTTITVHDKEQVDVGNHTEVEVSVEVPGATPAVIGKFSDDKNLTDSVCQSSSDDTVCKEKITMNLCRGESRTTITILLLHVARSDSSHTLTLIRKGSGLGNRRIHVHSNVYIYIIHVYRYPRI